MNKVSLIAVLLILGSEMVNC